MDKPWATRRVAHRLPTGRRLPTSSTALNPIDIKSGKVKTKTPAPALAYSTPVAVQTTGTTALEVLDAQRDLLTGEQQLAQTRRALISAHIDLYAALGGGTQSLAEGAPAPADDAN